MKVVHAVQGMGPDVVDQSVAAVGDSLGLGSGPRGSEHLGQHLPVAGLYLQRVLDVTARHDQEVHRGGRVYVEEGIGPLGGNDLLRRDLSGDDLAEQAVGHRNEGTVAGMGGPGGDGTSSADGFLADLARWAASDRTARAATERTRTRTLADQSLSTSTWTGLLVDLAESGAEVALWSGPGLTHKGRLVGVARDFVVLEPAGRGPVLIRTAALQAVTPAAPGARSARAGERSNPSELTLAAALEALAGERAPASVQTSSQAFPGAIIGCGEDVLTIKSDGPGRQMYVALNAVVWVEIR